MSYEFDDQPTREDLYGQQWAEANDHADEASEQDMNDEYAQDAQEQFDQGDINPDPEAEEDDQPEHDMGGMLDDFPDFD